jgi:opacity protein-like surface antigen
MRFTARMFTTMAAVALLTPTLLLVAQDPTAAASSAASAPMPGRTYVSYPKVEVFLGYSYLRGVPTLSPSNRMDTLNGGSANVAFNLNRYLGLVGDFGGFDDSELQLTGAGANPARVSDASGTAFTFMAGPRLSLRKYDRIKPFAQVLFGGIHASAVTLSNCSGTLCTPLPSENSFAMTAGGGVDVKVSRHVGVRLV